MCQLRLTTCSRGEDRRWSKLQRAGSNSGSRGGGTATTHAHPGSPRTQHRRGAPRRWGPPHQPRSPLLRAAGPRVPPRSAPGRREAWPARANLEAAMASMVEYKGLKAGYRCGYCGSEEGKASCGEWSGQRGRRGRLASKPRHRPPRSRPGPRGGQHPGRTSQLPLPFPTRFFPDRCPSHSVSRFHPYRDGGLFRRKSGNSGRLPSVKMAQAASAPRALPARLGLLAPGRRGALWGGGGGVGVGFGWAGPRLAFEGLGPWRPGPRFRPASWNISRARTSTAAATARTSRAVAPMVSGPGWWAGKGAGGSAAGGCPRGVAASRAEWLEGRVQAPAQA